MKIILHLLIKSCGRVTKAASSMRDIFKQANSMVELYIFCKVS